MKILNLYAGIGGIRASAPGFREIELRPEISEALSLALSEIGQCDCALLGSPTGCIKEMAGQSGSRLEKCADGDVPGNTEAHAVEQCALNAPQGRRALNGLGTPRGKKRGSVQ